MQNFLKNILPLIVTFFSGCYKFFKKEVLPIIHFIEAIKDLIELLPTINPKSKTTIDPKGGIVDFIEWLATKLGWNIEYLEKFIVAFIGSIKTLLPEIITGETFEECLLQYIKYLKSCSKWQLSWTLLKTASLMIIEFSPDKDLKEHQADFLAQTGYTYIKSKNK